MSEVRRSYVTWKGGDHGVSWHPISKQVYVNWGTWKYAGKAYDMQEAIDRSLGWLNSHAR